MRIVAEDLATGKKFTGEAKKLTDEDIRELNNLRTLKPGGTKRTLESYIDNLSDEKLRIFGHLKAGGRAEARRRLYEHLYDMSQVVIQVGNKVIFIGLKLLETVFDCARNAANYAFKEYPHTLFGFVFGFIVGALILNIPMIGFLFGALALKIATIIGAVIGYQQDIANKRLERAVLEANLRFENLKTA